MQCSHCMQHWRCQAVLYLPSRWYKCNTVYCACIYTYVCTRTHRKSDMHAHMFWAHISAGIVWIVTWDCTSETLQYLIVQIYCNKAMNMSDNFLKSAASSNTTANLQMKFKVLACGKQQSIEGRNMQSIDINNKRILGMHCTCTNTRFNTMT